MKDLNTLLPIFIKEYNIDVDELLKKFGDTNKGYEFLKINNDFGIEKKDFSSNDRTIHFVLGNLLEFKKQVHSTYGSIIYHKNYLPLSDFLIAIIDNVVREIWKNRGNILNQDEDGVYYLDRCNGFVTIDGLDLLISDRVISIIRKGNINHIEFYLEDLINLIKKDEAKNK